MRRMAVFFAGTSLVAAIAVAYLWAQLRDGNRLIAELQEQVRQLQLAPAAVAPVRPVAPEPAPAPAPVSPGVAQAAAGSVDASAVAPQRTLDCDAQRDRIRSSLAARNAALAAALKLTSEETERMLDIQVARVAQPLLCARAGSPPPEETYEAQLLAALGPARYEQLQDHNTANTTRENVSILRSQLQTANAPLDAEQEQRLTATIMEQNRRMRALAATPVPPMEARARLEYEEQSLKLTEEKFERILAEAESYLNPAQIAQLKGNMVRQVTASRQSLGRMRATVQAGGRISPAVPDIVLMVPPPGN